MTYQSGDQSGEREFRRALVQWERAHAPSGPGWLLTGLAVAGIGFLAWNYLGTDLIRYIKMERMQPCTSCPSP